MVSKNTQSIRLRRCVALRFGVLTRVVLGFSLVGISLLGGCAVLLPSQSNLSSEQAPPESLENFDPFREAVGQATQAATLGQSASTAADWQDIAQRWQAAGALMQSVPPSHPNYAIAQQRAKEDYATNAAIAQQHAAGATEEALTTDDDSLTKVDFGDGWPFIIDGELFCEQITVGERQINLVTLYSLDKTFAVNGPAQARAKERGWYNIDALWRSSDDGAAKAPINWVVMRAEAICRDQVAS
ncbi:MAG: hypothetical protein WBA10_09970 [Elainellaceae cyanobacterium]